MRCNSALNWGSSCMTGEVNEPQEHSKVRPAGFRCSLEQELRVRAKETLKDNF